MDVIVQAVSGAMAKTGFPDGPPLRSGITIADHTTATFAALGIVAALRQRDLTGVGQLVDVAMLDVLTALVFDEPVDHYAASGMPGAHRQRRRARRAHQRVSLRGRVGRGDLHERRTVRAAVRPDGATRTANALSRRTGARRRRARARCRDRSVDRDTTGARLSRRRSSVSGSRPAACAIRSRPPPTRPYRVASCSRSCATPTRRSIAPAGSSARASRSSSTDASTLPAAERFGASTDAVLHELAGCDDAELARLRDTGVIA